MRAVHSILPEVATDTGHPLITVKGTRHDIAAANFKGHMAAEALIPAFSSDQGLKSRIGKGTGMGGTGPFLKLAYMTGAALTGRRAIGFICWKNGEMLEGGAAGQENENAQNKQRCIQITFRQKIPLSGGRER